MNMNGKRRQKWLVLLLAAALAGAAALFFILQRPDEKELNPNLLAGDYQVELPADAEERFSKLVKGSDLEDIFKRDTINRYYPRHNWTGRVRDRGVSHQALFSIDNARVVYRINSLGREVLLFSIYNPAGSKLFYRIFLEDKARKRKIFSKFLSGLKFLDCQVNLDPFFKRGVRIVFETKGKGIGAWVNPRFKRVKRDPRVVVLIVLDTVRYDHTSLYGYERKTTPQLDQLAQDARVFTNAFSSTSWTLPAHVSLFSGRDLVQHKVTAPENLILEDYPLAAEVFQDKGFVTAAFTGGGFVNDQYGFHRGFQFYSDVPGRIFMLDSAEKVFGHFQKYIDRFWGEDVFVFLHTYQAHAPYKALPKYVRHFNKDLSVNLKGPGNFIRDKKVEIFKPIAEENRQILVDLYDTAIFYTDEALVGGAVQFLKDKGVYQQVLVVVTSDHGEEFYDHGGWEHGHSLYNELIRIPLVIKYPQNKIKGLEAALVSITDIPGLLLKESGLSYEGDDFLVQIGEKERLLPVLFPHSPIIKHIPPRLSFVDDSFHFIYNIIDRQEIKVFSPQPRELEIYELYRRSDTQEKHNLAKKESTSMNDFRQSLKKYLRLLRNLEGKKGKLGKDLEKELKSLGYLRD